MYKNFFKRFFDFWAALVGLILISPIFILVSFTLLFANQGKIFYTQKRAGKNGKVFRVIKFKTMNDKKDENGELLPYYERITKVGRFMRTTSLDELPQLINVIIGQMSLIGPRPLYMEYLPLYTEEQNRRHEVLPGITGWAQVHGRNVCLLSKKFEYDVWYVDNLSFAVDLKIIYRTIKNVLAGKDINQGADSVELVDDLNFYNRIQK
ncbi:MAG: sugar transferase [Rikenellaceae bacterium]|nr:sugar transferase [Rikenellaceae bacterium]